MDCLAAPFASVAVVSPDAVAAYTKHGMHASAIKDIATLFRVFKFWSRFFPLPIEMINDF